MEIPQQDSQEKSLLPLNVGDPILVYTKLSRHRGNYPVFGFVSEVRPYYVSIGRRRRELTPTREIYLDDAFQLIEPVEIKGSVIPYISTLPITPHNLGEPPIKKSFIEAYLDEIVIGQDNVISHLRNRGELWGVYADWIARMQIR